MWSWTIGVYVLVFLHTLHFTSLTLTFLTKLLPGSDEIKYVKMPRLKESGVWRLEAHAHTQGCARIREFEAEGPPSLFLQ